MGGNLAWFMSLIIDVTDTNVYPRRTVRMQRYILFGSYEDCENVRFVVRYYKKHQFNVENILQFWNIFGIYSAIVLI